MASEKLPVWKETLLKYPPYKLNYTSLKPIQNPHFSSKTSQLQFKNTLIFL